MMQDLEKLAQELRHSGREREFQALADSADGRKLGQMIDAGAVETALKGGDSAALQQILQNVLRTAEGQRLAENLRKLTRK